MVRWLPLSWPGKDRCIMWDVFQSAFDQGKQNDSTNLSFEIIIGIIAFTVIRCRIDESLVFSAKFAKSQKRLFC